MTGPRADIHDGGPAFPTERFNSYGNGAGVTTRDGGMSLRDWFAGQALIGFYAGRPQQGFNPDFAPEDARIAYLIADAMLAARKGNGEAQDHG